MVGLLRVSCYAVCVVAVFLMAFESLDFLSSFFLSPGEANRGQRVALDRIDREERRRRRRQEYREVVARRGLLMDNRGVGARRQEYREVVAIGKQNEPNVEMQTKTEKGSRLERS